MKVIEKTPVAIADDDSIFRDGLINYINSWQEFEVVVMAQNGQDLLERLVLAPRVPEICLLDVNMPVLNGFEALARIKQKWPEMNVLALSAYMSEFVSVKMINLGANGFLTKDCSSEELRNALNSVNTRGYYYSQFISERNFQRAKNNYLLKITTREMEFLNLCCTDLGYKTIADKMGISVRTIESYRNSLYNKLKVKTRMGLIIFALKSGIVASDKL